jgi:mRNA-degrading endonuclease RelE of RelBE toxin-antitoxin system
VSDVYSLDLSEVAKQAYSRIWESARNQVDNGNQAGSHVKLLRLVDECLDTIIPHDPFNPKRALSGALSSVYRVKKGRIRICYVASSQHSRITVLYISETMRKEGDRRDPYAVFTKLVMSGEYDDLFEKIGIRKPPRRIACPPVQLQ